MMAFQKGLVKQAGGRWRITELGKRHVEA
jgi:hypothetical protein